MASNVNLSTVLKRLEAVTSRLEDVATSQSSSPAPASSAKSPASASHDTGSIAAAAVPTASASGASASSEMTPAVKAYQDDIVNGALADTIAKSKEVGGLVEQHASLTGLAFPESPPMRKTALLGPLCHAQLDFLQLASAHAKPSGANGLTPLLKPQADAIGKVMEAKDSLGRSKEGREWGACLSVVGEGVGAWGWVQVEPAPAPFVSEMKNASQFWADRVIKQFKETDPAAIAWSKSFLGLLDTIQKYVKQWHTTGVAWNPKGQPAPSSVPSSGSAAPAAPGPSAGGPPPPPPPPPADFQSPPKSSSGGGGGGQAALLADLNKGGSVTSGLRKVDPSQMTHKNPELRSSAVVPENHKKAPPAVGKKPATLAKKSPRLELEDGNKWMIENQENNREIVIDQTSLSHTVHVFNCTSSTIRVIGKINAVTMVGCKKTALVIDSAVSSLSITSSPSFEVQITGTVPTVQIDTTDSGAVYLSKECVDTVEIITSKTSSINISVPVGEEGDFKENPLPEQIKSVIKNGKVVSEIVEHAG